MGFTREELMSYVGATVPDLIGDYAGGSRIRLLFVGINPGLWTAATQTHFAHPGNRFYPALFAAGIIEREIDRGVGMTKQDQAYFVGRGLGISNIAHRATAKASSLTADELRTGGERLRGFVRTCQPLVVAIAGITAYRSAFRQPKAVMGEQPEGFEGAKLWVVPNPSGLNARETTASLATAYRAAAVAAGVVD